MKASPDAKSPRPATTGEAGAQAETLAARFLEARGLKLVERNWRSRFGELDLVLREGDTIVMVEVRMRRSKVFGGAAARRGRFLKK
jgi:putative endonuclease